MSNDIEQNETRNQANGAPETAPDVEGTDVVDAEIAEPSEGESETSSPKVVDKRRFARLLGFGFGAAAQEADETDDPPRERLPSYVEELKERAERVEAAARAETDAARARLERHYEGRLASARGDIIGQFLLVFDNLERALAVPDAKESVLFEGVEATRAQFLKTLESLGAEPVPGEGSEFDPEVHEAVDTVPVESAEEDGRVVQVLRRGFQFDGRLVRPSIVRIGKYGGS